jgi:hypothetical protein
MQDIAPSALRDALRRRRAPSPGIRFGARSHRLCGHHAISPGLTGGVEGNIVQGLTGASSADAPSDSAVLDHAGRVA